jgi:pimeloyl-ACP methyl ester carboxylesterase
MQPELSRKTLLACGAVTLDVEQAGNGRAVLLVHGTFNDASTWDPVFTSLAQHARAIRYDRRGYGKSQGPGVAAALHAMDLVELIRTLDLERVVLVGNSLGASIALRAFEQAPDRIALVLAQEPPILELMMQDPAQQVLGGRIRSALKAAVAAARSGDGARAAQIYVEGVTSAPNAWAYLPEEFRRSMQDKAPAFGEEADLDNWFSMHLAELQPLADRLIITRGERSGPFLRLIADEINAKLPCAQRYTYPGAGHVAHQSCPKAFVTHVVESLAMLERRAV